MSQPGRDRELRRMVVDLAALQPDDREAVLSDLALDHRGTIERLLRELLGFGFEEQALPAAPAPEYDRSSLSPWLIQRLDADSADVTGHARKTLHDCAKRICTTPPERTVVSRVKAGPVRSMAAAIGRAAA
jgi:hypothetical protein